MFNYRPAILPVCSYIEFEISVNYNDKLLLQLVIVRILASLTQINMEAHLFWSLNSFLEIFGPILMTSLCKHIPHMFSQPFKTDTCF